jgi:hypothetical protein
MPHYYASRLNWSGAYPRDRTGVLTGGQGNFSGAGVTP